MLTLLESKPTEEKPKAAEPRAFVRLKRLNESAKKKQLDLTAMKNEKLKELDQQILGLQGQFDLKAIESLVLEEIYFRQEMRTWL